MAVLSSYQYVRITAVLGRCETNVTGVGADLDALDPTHRLAGAVALAPCECLQPRDGPVLFYAGGTHTACRSVFEMLLDEAAKWGDVFDELDFGVARAGCILAEEDSVRGSVEELLGVGTIEEGHFGLVV